MKETADVVACVVDRGLFLPIARRLARDFKKVYYDCPSTLTFPSVSQIIGDGFEDVEYVSSLWEIADECDVFVFPDVGFAPMQNALLNRGACVWGSRDADQIEISRGKFMETLMTTDLPLPRYKRIIGMTDLQNALKDQTDKWIKISKYRGDWETIHFRSWDEDENILNIAGAKFGPWKDLIPFYVFDAIDAPVEGGYDGWCIDGNLPSLCMTGIESKDKAYLATFQKYNELPEEVRKATDAFAPILKTYGYRSYFSTEIRITDDGDGYFLDPTCRAGSPPSQVQSEMIANYGDVIWRGANGECVDPIPLAEFGIQTLLTVKGGRQNWSVVTLPDELQQWVKCGFCSQINGKLVFPPDPAFSDCELGWLIAIGDSPKQAIERLNGYIEKLPENLKANVESLAELLTEVEEAKAQGVTMTDKPMPDPSIVISDS